MHLLYGTLFLCKCAVREAVAVLLSNFAERGAVNWMDNLTLTL